MGYGYGPGQIMHNGYGIRNCPRTPGSGLCSSHFFPMFEMMTIDDGEEGQGK